MIGLNPEEEAALLLQARSSVPAERERAFNQLFERTRASVYALCFNVVGTRSEAEDAVQESFFGIHEALPHFRAEARLSTWMYRIALRCAWRVKARRPQQTERLEAGLEVPSNDFPPDALAESRQRARQLQLALRPLSEEHRAVLALFAVEGLSHGEIAAVLGIPEGTVWSRLHQARKRLAAELSRFEGGPSGTAR